MRQRVWIAILLAGIGWGSGDVATRAAFEHGAGPYVLAATRTGIAAVAVIAYLLMRRRSFLLSLRLSRLGIIQGVLHLAAPYLLITLALQHASAGFVGLLMASTPVVTAIFAHFMLPSEPLLPNMLIGLAISASGVAILLGSGDSGLAQGGQPLYAFMLTAAAILAIGYSSVLAKRHAGEYDPFELGTEQFIVGAAVLISLALIVGEAPVHVSTALWGLFAYLGVVATVVPFVTFFWTLQHASATLASLSGYLVPLIAAGAGVLLLDEQLQPGLIWGGLLILLGVIVTDQLDKRRDRLVARRTRS